MGTKSEAEIKMSPKKRGKKVKRRNKVERRASYVSTPVRSQRNAACKSLRRSQRSQKKRRGLLSRLFSRNRDACRPPALYAQDTDDTTTTELHTPDVTPASLPLGMAQVGQDQAPKMVENGDRDGESQEKQSRTSSSSGSRGSKRKPRPRISFSSARTRRPKDVLNWLQWRSELNQQLSSHILSGNKLDMDDVAIRAVSESVDQDALKAILKAAYAKDHTTLDQVAYLVFGVPRIHDKENVNVHPSPPRRPVPEAKGRRSVLDAVYAQTPSPSREQTPMSAARAPMQSIEQSHGNAASPTHPPRGPIDTGQDYPKMPIYATPMKPVAGMYKNFCNRPNPAIPPYYGDPTKANRSNKYAVSPACKASPKRSQNAVTDNSNVRRNKKHIKDPNRCPTIDENFTMEYYHEANKVAMERLEPDRDQLEMLEDPEIDYESEEEEEDEADGEMQVAPPMLAAPMDAPRRRSRRGNRSRAGTPKGWAPSMAEILKAKSVLSPIASPGNSPPASPPRQRQVMPKYYGPPMVSRGRLATPQGSAPVSRQTSNASSSITLPGQRPHHLGYHGRQRCDSNLSSLPDSVVHAGARRRLSDLSSTAYSPTPPLPAGMPGQYNNDPWYGRRLGPPVAPKPRSALRPPVPCPPPPPPLHTFQACSSRRPFQYGGPGLPSDLVRAIQLNRKPSNLSSVGPYAS